MLTFTRKQLARRRLFMMNVCGAVHEVHPGTVLSVPTLQFSLMTTTLSAPNCNLQIDKVIQPRQFTASDSNREIELETPVAVATERENTSLNSGSSNYNHSNSNISNSSDNRIKTSCTSNVESFERNSLLVKDFYDVRCFGANRFIDLLKDAIIENSILEITGELHCVKRSESYNGKNPASTVIIIDQNKLRAGEHVLRILRSGNILRTLNQRQLLSEVIYQG